MTKTTIVLLNYNGIDYLEKFLPLVVRYSRGCSIAVADNGSTDGSVDLITEKFPDVVLIRLPYNGGFSEGYNKALSQIPSQYYILLNTDVAVTPEWTVPLVTLLDQNPSIAACQPKILSYHNKEQFEYAGAAGGFIDSLGFPFCRGRIFDTLETDRGQYNDIIPVFWATGACMAIRSEVFHRLGGFDSHFFAHMEEIDLCWRIHALGLKVYYNGHSTVYHVGGGTLPKSNPRKTYLNFRNGLTMLYKNTPGRQLLWKLPLRISLDIMAALQFLAKGSKDNFTAVLKALKDFIVMYRLNSERRRITRRTSPQDEVSGIYKGLIIKDYFFAGRKHFHQLKFK